MTYIRDHEIEMLFWLSYSLIDSTLMSTLLNIPTIYLNHIHPTRDLLVSQTVLLTAFKSNEPLAPIVFPVCNLP